MDWQIMETAPKDGTRMLAIVPDDDGEPLIRFVSWGKTSHVPMYGFCLADQGAEEYDLCDPIRWMPVPALPADVVQAWEQIQAAEASAERAWSGNG